MKIFYKSGATKSAEVWFRQLLKVKRWEPRKRDPERLLQECLVSKELHIFCSDSKTLAEEAAAKLIQGSQELGQRDGAAQAHQARDEGESDCLWEQWPRDLSCTASCCQELAWGEQGRRRDRYLKSTN